MKGLLITWSLLLTYFLPKWDVFLKVSYVSVWKDRLAAEMLVLLKDTDHQNPAWLYGTSTCVRDERICSLCHQTRRKCLPGFPFPWQEEGCFWRPSRCLTMSHISGRCPWLTALTVTDPAPDSCKNSTAASEKPNVILLSNVLGRNRVLPCLPWVLLCLLRFCRSEEKALHLPQSLSSWPARCRVLRVGMLHFRLGWEFFVCFWARQRAFELFWEKREQVL